MLHQREPADLRPRWRALAVLALWSAGLVAGRSGWLDGVPAALLMSLAAALCIAGVLTRGWWCRVVLMFALVSAGAGWWSLRVREAPATLVDQATPVVLHGLVASVPLQDLGEHNPMLSGRGTGPTTRWRMHLIGAETDAGWSERGGSVLVLVRERMPGVQMGDALRVRGVLEPVRGPENPGERDARPAARMDGRAGRVLVEQAALISRSDRASAWTDTARAITLRTLGHLRERAASALDAGLEPTGDPSARAMLRALLLGSEDRALAPITDAFGRLGLVHVLSISGFHLVVMAGMMLGLVRLTGDRGRAEPVIVALAVGLYLLIVPAEAPVLRSGIMVLALLLSEASGRRYDRISVLAYIAVALLLWRPTEAFNAGFQLSFGVTGALIWLASAWREKLLRPSIITGADPVAMDPASWSLSRRLRHGLAGLMTTSVLAWAVSVPLVMHHAGIISPLAWLTSIVLVPVFVLILWLGFLVLLLGAAWPAAASVAGIALDLLARATLAIVGPLDGAWWMALSVPAVPALWTIAATLTLALGLSGWGVRRASWWWMVAGVMVWLLVIVTRATALPSGVAARVHTLAVGAGSATIIHAGGDAVAFGLGSEFAGTLRRTVPGAARALGLGQVRVVVVPGTEERFFGGLVDVAPFLQVRDVLVPPGLIALAADRADSPAAELLRGLAARGINVRPVRAGEQIILGASGLTLTLNPSGDGRPALVGEVMIDAHRVLLAPALTPPGAARLIDARAGGGWSGVMLPPRTGPEAAAAWLLGGTARAAWRSTPRPGWGDAPASATPEGWYDTGVDGAITLELRRDGSARAGRAR
jgi:competence protein ComEC